MFMRTNRLFLRPGWPEDCAQLRRGLGDRAVARNLASVPWSCDELKDHASLARPFDPRTPNLLVTLPGADGAPVIGGCGFGPREHGDDIELGFWIARAHWGRGYATEAVRGLLSVARATGLRRLEADHFLDNPASARVLAKSGFAPTGEIVRRFSLARREAAPCARYAVDLDEAEARMSASVPAAA